MKCWVVEKALSGTDDWVAASGQCFTKAQAKERLALYRQNKALWLRIREFELSPIGSPLLATDSRPVLDSQKKWR